MTIFYDHFVYGWAFIAVGYYIGYHIGIKIGGNRVKREYDYRNLLDTLKQWEEAKVDFPHNCKWHCDICKRSRIDCLIGVVRYRAGDYMQINVKYCRDTKDCEEKAHTLAYWYSEPVTLIKAGD